MIIILLIGCGLYLIKEHKMPEDKFLFSGTSVVRSHMEKINNYKNVQNYRYTSKLLPSKNIRLKDISYSFLEEISVPSEKYPQGICFSDKYVFITLYSAKKDDLGIIMIFSSKTQEYLLSLGMDAQSHLGGITYDGESIWVCNSSKMSIERISLKFIEKAIWEYKGKFLDVRNIVDSYAVNVIPSCISFYDNKLWIATHAKQSNSQMISYTFHASDNRLYFDDIYQIPSKVQGVVFDENGRVLLSTSYGRRNSSYLKIYNSLDEMSKNVSKYMKSIEMPPCSEGLDIYDGKLYILFESASEKYLEGTDGKGKVLAPLDKILVIDLTYL